MTKNRAEIAEKVDEYIRQLEEEKAKYSSCKHLAWIRSRLRIEDVCEDLSIFDWWNAYLSISQLKQMKSFLKVAGELGYNGYVCFKVGAKGGAHGMWAHKEESTDGYSPKGECLYHSFVNGENYYDCLLPNGKWMSSRDKFRFSLKEVKYMLKMFENPEK